MAGTCAAPAGARKAVYGTRSAPTTLQFGSCNPILNVLDSETNLVFRRGSWKAITVQSSGHASTQIENRKRLAHRCGWKPHLRRTRGSLSHSLFIRLILQKTQFLTARRIVVEKIRKRLKAETFLRFLEFEIDG